MANKTYLLDCTLRDGGYINDWEFSRGIYDAVSTELQLANVDFIKLGIMGSHNADHFKTKFRSLEEIPLPKKLNKGSSFKNAEGTHELFYVVSVRGDSLA